MVGIGNGGRAGSIVPTMLSGPLKLGFAVVTTDMGTSAGPDCGIGNRAVWQDFGYRSTHLMTLTGKALIEAWYGLQPKHSYFVGGSTGGQQALSEAQRYPEDYDGILACAPAHDRVNLHLAFLWDWLNLNAKGVAPFSEEDEKKIVNALLKSCAVEGDRRDDDNFLRTRSNSVYMRVFSRCGLSKPQTDALMAVYEGLYDQETKERIYEPTLIPGSEASGMGLAYRCDEDIFAKEFFYLFRWVLGADFNFKKFDFQKDSATVHEALDDYLNATSPDLRSYRNSGGKLLLIHGTADAIIPYTSSIRYFDSVEKEMGNTSDFLRLFLMPGMGHVFGGPGVQDFVYGLPATPKDAKHLGLLALKDWVETNKAPDRLYPVAFKQNPPFSAFSSDGVAYEREVTPFRN
jgi:feruloyl esterase